MIAAGLAALLGGYGLFVVPTRWLKVERIRHPLGLGIKLLQLSDFHVEMLRIRPRTLAALIRQERPDYIVLTGDFTQKERHLPKLRPYLAMLQESGIPAYAVLGNHDHHMRKVSRLVQLLKEYGIVTLRNDSIHLERFQLLGIDDFSTGRSNAAQAFRSVTDDRPRIVITHDPNLVLYLNRSYDYLMAGHLHGKQFNVPFFFRLRPMGRLPAMGIYKGLHKSPWGMYYISKGLGQTGYNIRFLVRSEATVHEL
jgi:hypothetical protein